jgi:hypothetical protein
VRGKLATHRAPSSATQQTILPETREIATELPRLNDVENADEQPNAAADCQDENDFADADHEP